MSKYLGFQSAGFDFLIDAQAVVEVFDVDASPEAFAEVLVGKKGRAYWRGVLSQLVDLTSLLGGSQGKGHCYVVCNAHSGTTEYHVLKVDAINSLYDFEESSFLDIRLNDKHLMNITSKVCITREADNMYMLIKDVEKICDLAVVQS